MKITSIKKAKLMKKMLSLHKNVKLTHFKRDTNKQTLTKFVQTNMQVQYVQTNINAKIRQLPFFKV